MRHSIIYTSTIIVCTQTICRLRLIYLITYTEYLNQKVEFPIRFRGQKRLFSYRCEGTIYFTTVPRISNNLGFLILHQLAKIGIVFTSVIMSMTSSGRSCSVHKPLVVSLPVSKQNIYCTL